MAPITKPEFAALMPPLLPEEQKALFDSIRRDGIRDPVVIWNGFVLDGHNRMAIAEELNVPYQTVEIELESEEAAFDWIMHNQMARRNLSPDQKLKLFGPALKVRLAGKPGKLSVKIAKELGVSRSSADDFLTVAKQAPEKLAEPTSLKQAAKVIREKAYTVNDYANDFAEEAEEIGFTKDEYLEYLNGSGRCSNGGCGFKKQNAEEARAELNTIQPRNTEDLKKAEEVLLAAIHRNDTRIPGILGRIQKEIVQTAERDRLAREGV